MSKVGLVFLLVIITQTLVLQGQAMPMPHESDQKSNKIANQPVAGSKESSISQEAVAEAPHLRRLGKHHSTDKSVAGGGVIIGGLATVIFVAVISYIRVTRKRESGY